ncbi:MAG: metallophosphoesterase [Candidatus Altiarchaeota archaeon]|nr:metallophosphoesterase [Candidatus Altiarchaeota archaeon]
MNEVVVVDEDVPPAFDGVRMVFVSDIHCGDLYSPGRMRELVGLINSLRPDIVLLGGDYTYSIWDDDDPANVGPCLREFSNLTAPLGVYAVLGSHDNWAGHDMSMEALADAGVKVLDNSAEWVVLNGSRIKIGGVGDVGKKANWLSFRDGRLKLGGFSDLWNGSQDITPTVEDAGEGDFVMLLAHDPRFAERLDNSKVDLVLSGHTHGGQVTFFGWLPDTLLRLKGYSNLKGVYDMEHARLIVTTGVGTGGLPLRFFARPEVVVLTLRSKN